MKDKKYIAYALISLFATIQLVLTILIFIADKNAYFDTTIIKYSGIILCFITSLFFFKKDKSYFLTAGLGFTLIADYFLLVINKYYIAGISSFIIVQILYFLYIKPDKWKLSFLIRLSLFAIASLVAAFVLGQSDITVFFAAFYFVNLLMNCVDSWFSLKNGLLLFAIGLTLFIGCDVSVGFYNLSSYISYSSDIIGNIVSFSRFGMWLFYLPSQTLIALSPYFRDKK